MGKAGRKRKAGVREPNGKLQRPTLAALRALEVDKRRREMSVVLAQPHRRGETHHWAGSVFGRFCLRNALSPETHEAGQQFGKIVAAWRASRGVPVASNRTPGTPPSEPATAKEHEAAEKRHTRLRERMVEAERILIGQGIEALVAVRQLVVDEYDLSHEQDAHAIMGLNAMAVHLGLVGRRSYRGAT